MKTTTLVSAIFFIPLLSTQAATIYSHSFSGGTGDLNGIAVDTGSGSWEASSQFNADGSIADIGASGTQGGSATLAFTPTDGLIYTLDASFTGISGNANWIAMGFAAGQSTQVTFENRFLTDQTIGKAWMFARGDTSSFANVAFLGSAGLGNDTGFNLPSTFNVGTLDFRIVLDTTGGAGSWTAAWYAKLPADGSYTEIQPATTLLDETITSVGIAKSSDGVTGTITSFELTSVPEPSTILLGGMGMLALLRRRR